MQWTSIYSIWYLTIYPFRWNNNLKELIRDRENRKCFICDKHENDLSTKLHVHHIDYNKFNLDYFNLVALCINCHMPTNFNRNSWTYILSMFIEFRYGNSERSLNGNIFERATTKIEAKS